MSTSVNWMRLVRVLVTQETRITQLLKQIAELEAEIERLDAVVIKMAEKYSTS